MLECTRSGLFVLVGVEAGLATKSQIIQGIITGIGLLGGGVTGRCLPQIKST